MPDAPGTPATPTRRQRLPADERRTQIVRAAIDVVAASGSANATLTAIAETAGIGKGLLWHYFDDRDDLMQQVAASVLEQLREAVVRDVDLTAPAPEVIRAVFARTAQFTRTHRAEVEAIDQIVHDLRSPDGRRRLSMRDYESTYADHEALLLRGRSDGHIRSGDLRVMAVGYQGMIDAMIAYLQANPDVEPLPYAAQMADLFLAGAAVDPTGPDSDLVEPR